jgi:hypothetical protein
VTHSIQILSEKDGDMILEMVASGKFHHTLRTPDLIVYRLLLPITLFVTPPQFFVLPIEVKQIFVVSFVSIFFF